MVGYEALQYLIERSRFSLLVRSDHMNAFTQPILVIASHSSVGCAVNKNSVRNEMIPLHMSGKFLSISATLNFNLNSSKTHMRFENPNL